MSINEPISTLYLYMLKYLWKVASMDRDLNTVIISISGVLDYPDVEYMSPVIIKITLAPDLTTFALQ